MRIRKHSQLIPHGAVVFDLDGTLIDQRAIYQSEAKRRGYTLSLAECNYNVIKQHVPGEILAEIDEFVLGDATKNAQPFPGALDVLREWSTSVYIVSGRSTDLQKSAYSWLQVHAPVFSQNHVLFFPSTAAKAKALVAFDIALAVDDQIAPVKALPDSTVRLLFDPDEAFANDALPGIRIVRDWETIASIMRSTVRPTM